MTAWIDPEVDRVVRQKYDYPAVVTTYRAIRAGLSVEEAKSLPQQTVLDIVVCHQVDEAAKERRFAKMMAMMMGVKLA